ncbi:MAG: hypothetical protein M4579_006524 [Chaenotheca gracillima]|nr:MAG: hypothetical protein M4579_006524 [Chaenotheca gracillima]
MASAQSELPKFSDLPLNKGDPPHSAWGLYGKDDQLGTLNRLTNEVVLAAKDEIKTGTSFFDLAIENYRDIDVSRRVSLNWPLDAQSTPLFARQAFHKDIVRKSPRIVNDDVWTFNSQSSSQWDGLRHFAYQKEQKFYNGVTMDDIHGDGASTVNGIQAWSEKGIVGRGILLDYHSWRLSQGISFDPLSTSSIPLAHLKAVAEAQGTEIRFGDILIIRSGGFQNFHDVDARK